MVGEKTRSQYGSAMTQLIEHLQLRLACAVLPQNPLSGVTGGAKGIDPCAHLLPKVTVPGVSVDQNMREAENQVASLRSQTALLSPDGTPMADSPGGAIDLWFFSMVAERQPWDYKYRDPEGAAKGNSIYEDFGNFNFGATGAAAG
jgi:hypothetical protein